MVRALCRPPATPTTTCADFAEGRFGCYQVTYTPQPKQASQVCHDLIPGISGESGCLVFSGLGRQTTNARNAKQLSSGSCLRPGLAPVAGRRLPKFLVKDLGQITFTGITGGGGNAGEGQVGLQQ
jgi:hypothetical protein